MRNLWSGALAWMAVDGTPVQNTAGETIIFPNVPIAGTFMHHHRTLHLKAFGKYSCTGTPTLTFRLRWGGVGGTLIALSEAITCGSGVSNANWSIEALLQARVDGATGKIIVMGELKVHTAAGTVVHNVFGVSGWDAPAEVTVDLQAAADLALSVQWSAADAANTLTGLLELVNAEN